MQQTRRPTTQHGNNWRARGLFKRRVGKNFVRAQICLTARQIWNENQIIFFTAHRFVFHSSLNHFNWSKLHWILPLLINTFTNELIWKFLSFCNNLVSFAFFSNFFSKRFNKLPGAQKNNNNKLNKNSLNIKQKDWSLFTLVTAAINWRRSSSRFTKVKHKKKRYCADGVVIQQTLPLALSIGQSYQQIVLINLCEISSTKFACRLRPYFSKYNII